MSCAWAFNFNRVPDEGVMRGGGGGGGREHLNGHLTGRCPFFKGLHNPFRKKICILIPCF